LLRHPVRAERTHLSPSLSPSSRTHLVPHDDRSPSGQPIYRHRDLLPDNPDGLRTGDPELIDAISAHIAAHVGKIDNVFHELFSPHVHIDVHHVAPSPERPFHVLVTSGMSERPMKTPEAANEFRYAELLICLPESWPISQATFVDEAHYWPVRWLKQLARLPHEYGSWFGFGHSIPNNDPPEPLADGTRLCGWLLLPPLVFGGKFQTLTLPDGRVIHFWSLIALHEDEMTYKLKHGAEGLLEFFDEGGVSDVLDPRRPSCVPARKKGWWPFG
jgi:hypothetical protein